MKLYNVEADSQDERSYEIITSNNAQDFMETSPLSPNTQDDQSITASTTLDNEDRNIDNETETNLPLSRRSPRRISPSEIHFSIGDKTTKIIYNKKNVARKSIARKTTNQETH